MFLIITEPMAALSAMAEPEMPPKIIEAPTTTMPSPPGMKPKAARAKPMMRRPTPPRLISSPATMKSGMARKWLGSTPPMKLRNSACERIAADRRRGSG